ncbi:CONSTANS-like zinc finger protein [Quillaja saponaria]|uniref:CONSTANS-like zinc finger protein n=1 Tax=Quillaja saponaria TaxID=32244 RepID=A0AAD7PYY1_QUISA|nr:CONSTANS-like zinc finger protein [Quillaja saponaria]
MSLPCDFCNSKTAVLYCRADSAKLCLFCDQLVHSANPLSLKHVRSPIYDNCGNESATVRCSTDNLSICQDCDWDSHNCLASSLHERNLVQGFSGCPSPIELASPLGFSLEQKNMVNMDSWLHEYEQKLMNFQGIMVPTVHSSVFMPMSKEQNFSRGKYKDDIYEQLVEMGKRDLVRVDKDGADLVPKTPPIGRAQQGNLVSLELENNGDGYDYDLLLQQQTPFSSVLSFATNMDMRKKDYVTEGDLFWDCSPTYHAAQVWDFELRKSRDFEESTSTAADCQSENNGFTVKSYSDVLEETNSLTMPEIFHNVNEVYCSTIGEDILSRNNQSYQSPSHITKNEVRNHDIRGGLSSESTMIESLICNGTMEHLLGTGENANRGKADFQLDVLAKNRGDAMLRYKEKKKTRSGVEL